MTATLHMCFSWLGPVVEATSSELSAHGKTVLSIDSDTYQEFCELAQPSLQSAGGAVLIG